MLPRHSQNQASDGRGGGGTAAAAAAAADEEATTMLSETTALLLSPQTEAAAAEGDEDDDAFSTLLSSRGLRGQRGGAYGATASLIDEGNRGGSNGNGNGNGHYNSGSSNSVSSRRRWNHLDNNNNNNITVETVLSSDTTTTTTTTTTTATPDDSPASASSTSSASSAWWWLRSTSPLSGGLVPGDSPASADAATDADGEGRAAEADQEPGGEEEASADGNGGDGDGDDGTTRQEGAIGTLTRRLRCLFSTITWPIVPLGTIVALALLWVLYAASSLDLRKSCSHPLHWYALASLVLVAYLPHHAQARSHLFRYSRERDGPVRPARVRMYDQFFHTICLLYVYTGVTLIQTCREDLVPTNGGGDGGSTGLSANGGNGGGPVAGNNDLGLPSDEPLNSCQATCPNLYQALSVYVATLEVFTFALILPLLFLPCIYLWFLRRATAEAEAFAQLQDRLQEEEALLSNGGATVGDILDGLDSVKLVARTSQLCNGCGNGNNSGSMIGTRNGEGPGEGPGTASSSYPSLSSAEEDLVWLVPYSATDASIGMASNVKECCICMSEFPVHSEADLEGGLFEENSGSRNTSRSNNRGGTGNGRRHDDTTTTPRGDNSDDDSDYEDDDGPKTSNRGGGDDDDASSNGKMETGIVRTRCGHVFHRECLAGWVGGRWQLHPNNSGGSGGGGGNEETTHQDRRRRKARQTGCPLCREDLRPSTTAN